MTNILDTVEQAEFDTWFKDYYGFIPEANGDELQEAIDVFGWRNTYETGKIVWKACRKQVLLEAAEEVAKMDGGECEHSRLLRRMAEGEK